MKIFLILFPYKGKDLNLKSTPIVARKTSLNSSSAYLTTIDDFPTQEFPKMKLYLPTKTTLNK